MTEYYGHLPKFPEPAIKSSQTDSVMRVTTIHSFSHDQMDEYGQACYEAGLRARQAPAPVEVSDAVLDRIADRHRWDTREGRRAMLRDALVSMASTPVGESADCTSVIGMPFAEARKVILGLDAEAARGLAISFLIQLSIATKYAASTADQVCGWCTGTGKFADHNCRFCNGKGDALVFAASPAPAASKGELHQPTNVEDAVAGNENAIRHIAYAEGYRDGKGAASKAMLSWAGFNLHGDDKSIEEAKRLLHEAGTVPELKEIIRSMQAAPSEPEAQKAVAWMVFEGFGNRPILEAFSTQERAEEFAETIKTKTYVRPLYSQPAASMEVQGLTDRETTALFIELNVACVTAESPSEMFSVIVRAVERALAAKNGWRLGEVPAAESAHDWKSRLITDACSKWSGNQKIEAGDIIEWIADRRVLAASPTPAASKGAEAAYSYALNLATTLWKRHYKTQAPDWQPLDGTLGLLTQIDNMVAGLAAPSEPEAQKAVAPFDHDAYRKRIENANVVAIAHMTPKQRAASERVRASLSPSPAASMEVQGLTSEEVDALDLPREPDHDEKMTFVRALTRALAAKNGWRLGEGRE